MAFFSKESLEILKERIDLVEVVSSYVDLKKMGSFFKGLCPFHAEKTPSFVIQSSDTHYHCFGCSAHGDAISFLMNFLHVTFVEAVEILADRFNVVLEKKRGFKKNNLKDKTTLKNCMQKASEFFHCMLLYSKEGREGLKYLYERGVSLDFINIFSIGYAPKTLFLLEKFMKKHNIKMDVLEKVGLVRGDKKIDFFSDRIVIPVKDSMGNIIGFSARKFKEKTFGPKYVNSPETVLFKKSNMLFGFSFSRKRIAREKKAIIVEGQIDALRLIFEGVNIVVAGQGTAFGQKQVKKLLDLGVNKVYLALDGDMAGREASIKIGDFFQKEAVEVYIVPIPKDMDPDTFVREKGILDFLSLLDKSMDYLTFLVKVLSKGLDIFSPSGKNELISLLLKRIKEWNNPLMIHESVKKISKLTNTPEEFLKIENVPSNIYIKKMDGIYFEKIDFDKRLETDFLRFLMLANEKKELLDIAVLNLDETFFKISECRSIFKKYTDTFEEKMDLLNFSTFLEQKEYELFISDIMGKKVFLDKIKIAFLDALQKILDRNWLEKREVINKKLKSTILSEEEKNNFLKEFDLLKNNRPKIVFV